MAHAFCQIFKFICNLSAFYWQSDPIACPKKLYIQILVLLKWVFKTAEPWVLIRLYLLVEKFGVVIYVINHYWAMHQSNCSVAILTPIHSYKHNNSLEFKAHVFLFVCFVTSLYTELLYKMHILSTDRPICRNYKIQIYWNDPGGPSTDACSNAMLRWLQGLQDCASEQWVSSNLIANYAWSWIIFYTPNVEKVYCAINNLKL